jgi:hypothetical protein
VWDKDCPWLSRSQDASLPTSGTAPVEDIWNKQETMNTTRLWVASRRVLQGGTTMIKLRRGERGYEGFRSHSSLSSHPREPRSSGARATSA